MILPEDDANRQIANGFVGHPSVNERKIQILSPAAGWSKALNRIQSDLAERLRQRRNAYLALLIDFDGNYDDRREQFELATPIELHDRVFVLGAKEEPESIRSSLRITLEKLGVALAEECLGGTTAYWSSPALAHNKPDLDRFSTCPARVSIFQTDSPRQP